MSLCHGSGRSKKRCLPLCDLAQLDLTANGQKQSATEPRRRFRFDTIPVVRHAPWLSDERTRQVPARKTHKQQDSCSVRSLVCHELVWIVLIQLSHCVEQLDQVVQGMGHVGRRKISHDLLVVGLDFGQGMVHPYMAA